MSELFIILSAFEVSGQLNLTYSHVYDLNISVKWMKEIKEVIQPHFICYKVLIYFYGF